MPELATTADVSARLGREPTTEEAARIPGLLDESTVAVTEYLGCIPDPVPDAARIVVSRMVARKLASGEDVPIGLSTAEQTMGPFGYTRGYSPDATSGGVWLTRQDKNMLRRHGCRSRAENVATA